MHSRTSYLGLAAMLVAMPVALGGATNLAKGDDCRAVVFDGDVVAGQAFRKVFAPGLEFFLEPLRSGWIVRVLEMSGGREVRGPHDFAELATPPYRSVSPLLVSTDWAFRAQDAAGWNPREFRFAYDGQAFARLSALYDGVMANDAKASAEAAAIVAQQPEGQLQLLDVKMAPGTRDQAQMAAAVASHFAQTPHEVLQGEVSSTLGRLVAIKFRVRLELASGMQSAPGVTVQHFSCKLRPTG